MISKKFYIYILQSIKDETFYVGFTQNIELRLKYHNNGKSKYTKSHRPYQLIYSEEFKSKSEAKSREQYIKKYSNTDSFLKSRVPSNKVRD